MSRCGRAADDAVVGRPGDLAGTAVDARALHPEHGIDALEPLQRNVFPGVGGDVLVDAEEDRCGVGPTGRTMQAQRGAGVGHAAVEAAGVVRRAVHPPGLAVLVDAHHMQTRRPQRVGVAAADGLEVEGGARPEFGHVDDDAGVAGGDHLVDRYLQMREVDQFAVVCQGNRGTQCRGQSGCGQSEETTSRQAVSGACHVCHGGYRTNS
ncbi:Uncharacterised protein [Mycobacteroides abscessus subsp. abscessus]|nr:Uncharacterised protein [Mycobacteroides abscessus subsp. abscessus]